MPRTSKRRAIRPVGGFARQRATGVALANPDPNLAPDYMEPLTAYRAWQFSDTQRFNELAGFGSLSLCSLNSVPWQPKQAMVAHCTYGQRADVHEGHESPHPECSCGVYAGKNLEHLIEINYAQMGIHGEVSMWGNVLECELGYRAQYAYPKYFIVPQSMLGANFNRTKERFDLLMQFGVDIYVAGNGPVTRDMVKTLLIPAGAEQYTDEGVRVLTDGVQCHYDAISRIKGTPPKVGDRIMIYGKGLSVVNSITFDKVEVMLFNNTIAIISRADVQYNQTYDQFECRPTSFVTRGVRR